MSTPEQRDNLARIRDNQRRSRARRREYVHELEQRLRQCELQGVQASADVQAAARRVADENARLRELLGRTGVSEGYIAHYLQAGGLEQQQQHDAALAQPLGPDAAGPSVQMLQQAITPRRPSAPATPAAFPLPSQLSRETSAGSISTTDSSGWGSQPVMQSPYGQPQPMCAPPPITPMPAAVPNPFPTIPTTASQAHAFPGQAAEHMFDETQQQNYTTQPLPTEGDPGMGYGVPVYPYNQRGRGYGP